MYLTFGYIDDTTPSYKKFQAAYEKYGKPGAYSAYAYDAAYSLLSAIKAAGSTDPAKIKAELLKMDMVPPDGQGHLAGFGELDGIAGQAFQDFPQPFPVADKKLRHVVGDGCGQAQPLVPGLPGMRKFDALGNTTAQWTFPVAETAPGEVRCAVCGGAVYVAAGAPPSPDQIVACDFLGRCRTAPADANLARLETLAARLAANPYPVERARLAPVVAALFAAVADNPAALAVLHAHGGCRCGPGCAGGPADRG